ncbi:MAG: SLC13 family permease [Hyphomicrobiaceae bacterium]
MISSDYHLLTLFIVLIVLFALLIWGRIRYDIVALGALVTAVIAGIVPGATAFEGFGHPATIIIALVLVVSRGLTNSGAVDFIAQYFAVAGRSVSTHIASMAGIGAALSAVMNNVGALALLMPVDLQAAEKAKRSPGLTLMPLSFATILGGLVTLIGTPPNIIVSSIREKELGAPFQMFDFAPVGLGCAIVGVLFVAFIGWRLLPKETQERRVGGAHFELEAYLVELTVGPDSKASNARLRDLEKTCSEHEVEIVSILREGQHLPSYAHWLLVQNGDVFLIETAAENLDGFVKALGLTYGETRTDETQASEAAAEKSSGQDAPIATDTGDIGEEPSEVPPHDHRDFTMAEVVVRPGSQIEGRSARTSGLHDRFGVWLIGLSREGRRVTSRVRQMRLRAGDVLLLVGAPDSIKNASDAMGTLPLADRGLRVTIGTQAILAGALFVSAILLASFGILYLPIALAALTVLYVIFDIVPLRQLYDAIEWPVVVLIGALIPIGAALQTTGGTAVLATGLLDIAQGAPPWIVLAILMIVTMTLSDVLNNTATAIIAAPVAIGVAQQLNVSADPFLMAVAVAASCAFLTPIGHKNNTLVMGPGGYRFGDYWRMGLPLEILVVVIAIPLILLVWPF